MGTNVNRVSLGWNWFSFIDVYIFIQIKFLCWSYEKYDKDKVFMLKLWEAWQKQKWQNDLDHIKLSLLVGIRILDYNFGSNKFTLIMIWKKKYDVKKNSNFMPSIGFRRSKNNLQWYMKIIIPRSVSIQQR